jgi:hypothetical protein
MDNSILPLFDDADEIVEHPLVGHHGALTKASYLLQIITPYTPEVVQPIFKSDTTNTATQTCQQLLKIIYKSCQLW